MPQSKNPFDQFDAPRGPIFTDPTQPYKAPIAAADLAAKQQEAEQRRLAIAKAQRDLANTPEADLSPEVLANIKAGRPVRLEDLSPGDRGIVSGLLQGNLPAGQRSIASKSMLPYIKMAMSVDPGFSANTFAARQKATQQLADMKSTGGYLTSLTANIDHSREEEAAIRRLGNPGGLYGRFGGAALHNWLYNKNGPAEAQFNQANRVYSGEQVKSITGNVGNAGGQSALADRQDAERAISTTMPSDAQFAALRTGAVQNYQKYLDANAGYRRTMGADIPEPMSQSQAQQLLHLMRLKDDGTEGPVPQDINPSFLALATGQAGGPTGGTPGTNGGNGPPGGPGGPSPLFDAMNKATFGPPTGPETIDTQYKGVDDPSAYEHYKTLNSMIGAGAPDAAIMSKAMEFGFDPANVKTILDYSHKTGLKNFGFSGNLQRREPLSTGERVVNSVVANPVTTFVGEGANKFFAGIPQDIAEGIGGDDMRRKIAAARNTNPNATTWGQLAGTAGGAMASEIYALKGLNAAKALPWVNRALSGEKAADIATFGARRLADTTFGATSGFSEAQPGSGTSGALFGGLAGLGGGLLGEGVGRYALEPVTRSGSRMMFGGAAKPSPIDMSISKAVGNNSGDVQGALAEANSLGLPMSLADTNPNLRSLAGAAVRRSPTASGVAENALIPRGRGQIDRFQGAIERDLGPTTNIPQLTDEMIKAARLKAGPLYDQAYAAPPIASPKINEILNTPFGQDGLKQAIAIAKNERVDPNALSVDFNAAGEPVMKPTPNTRTLDLVKRGMDDVLEQYRNPITGRLDLNDMGQSQNNVKTDMLKEMDLRNPAYGQARAAYAGPAQEKDWIRRGGDAFKLDPNTLAFNAGKIPADKMPMAQLGYRGALSDAGNSVGYGSNPFERTLGTPAAESRLSTMYPDSPGPANLLRQRDLERQMQNTSNDILGNSKTAQRGIADEAFAGEDLPQLGFDIGSNLLMGQVPIGTVVKANLGRRLADAYKLGVGKKAVAKADALAPILLNTNPIAGSDELAATLARTQSYRDYIARRKGMFGGSTGIIGSGAFAGLANQ